LLDRQDRHVPLAAQTDQRPADVLDDGGLDAFGRLVEQRARRNDTAAIEMLAVDDDPS
jgi:hypothetical protein